MAAGGRAAPFHLRFMRASARVHRLLRRPSASRR